MLHTDVAPKATETKGEVGIDRDQIAEFVRRAFKHATPGEGVIAVRSFMNDNADRTARDFDWVPIDDNAVARIAESAAAAARRGAGATGWTFAPPVCLFKPSLAEGEKRTAKEADIVFGSVIAVDLDERPDASLAALKAVLGEPTIIVSSGGLWHGEERRHVYWRLRQPARDRLSLGHLRVARECARALVAGDKTGDPINHPMRWPGSVHTKAEPRPTRITGGDSDREVDLIEAGAALLDALHEAGIELNGHVPDRPGKRDGFKTEKAATTEQLLAIAKALPNEDLDWKHYRNRMMGWFDAAHGSLEGLEAAHTWAKKSAKYDPDEVDSSWSHIAFYPADNLSIGSLIYLCQEANPAFVLPRAEAFDPSLWLEPAPAEGGGILDGVENHGVSWKAFALKGDNKKPAAVLANVTAALRLDERISDAFAFDEMAVRPVLLKALPGEPVLRKHRFVEDNDISRLQVYLQVEGLTRLGRDTTKQGILLRSSERSFHPVRDYLDRVRWDGTARIEGWLSRYLGAERKLYHERIGAMFLISMVARVMQPGCQSDHMVVLEGEQGEQKSTACAVLAGEWFSDAMPDIRQGKDASIHLAGKWLIEVAEMSAMSKADHAALKAFISRQRELYRPPFGTFEVDQPRQVTFIGTTNSKAYLRDETGARRFWPVQTGKIDIGALRRDRDQLFAEAVAQYRDGKPWWPEKSFERTFVAPEQEARFEVDAWEESISDWLANRDEPFRVGDVARDGLHILTPRIGTSDQRRITAALERLGYRRRPKDRRGDIFWEAKRVG